MLLVVVVVGIISSVVDRIRLVETFVDDGTMVIDLVGVFTIVDTPTYVCTYIIV